jgi:hypothetical protein
VFGQGNDQNYEHGYDGHDDMNHAKHGNDATTRLKSTGKSAKKRRSGVVVDDGEDAEEDDEEDDCRLRQKKIIWDSKAVANTIELGKAGQSRTDLF